MPLITSLTLSDLANTVKRVFRVTRVWLFSFIDIKSRIPSDRIAIMAIMNNPTKQWLSQWFVNNCHKRDTVPRYPAKRLARTVDVSPAEKISLNIPRFVSRRTSARDISVFECRFRTPFAVTLSYLITFNNGCGKHVRKTNVL